MTLQTKTLSEKLTVIKIASGHWNIGNRMQNRHRALDCEVCLWLNSLRFQRGTFAFSDELDGDVLKGIP